MSQTAHGCGPFCVHVTACGCVQDDAADDTLCGNQNDFKCQAGVCTDPCIGLTCQAGTEVCREHLGTCIRPAGVCSYPLELENALCDNPASAGPHLSHVPKPHTDLRLHPLCT
jgi:hypothetical protein